MACTPPPVHHSFGGGVGCGPGRYALPRAGVVMGPESAPFAGQVVAVVFWVVVLTGLLLLHLQTRKDRP